MCISCVTDHSSLPMSNDTGLQSDCHRWLRGDPWVDFLSFITGHEDSSQTPLLLAMAHREQTHVIACFLPKAMSLFKSPGGSAKGELSVWSAS